MIFIKVINRTEKILKDIKINYDKGSGSRQCMIKKIKGNDNKKVIISTIKINKNRNLRIFIGDSKSAIVHENINGNTSGGLVIYIDGIDKNKIPIIKVDNENLKRK